LPEAAKPTIPARTGCTS